MLSTDNFSDVGTLSEIKHVLISLLQSVTFIVFYAFHVDVAYFLGYSRAGEKGIIFEVKTSQSLLVLLKYSLKKHSSDCCKFQLIYRVIKKIDFNFFHFLFFTEKWIFSVPSSTIPCLFNFIFKISIIKISVPVSSVQLLSCVLLFATPSTAECQTSLSIINSKSLLRLMPTELVMPSTHLILYHPLLLLPSVFPSIRFFANESTLRISWSKYWSFSFNISPCNAYSGLISFMMEWLNLLEVQGTLKSLLQHHSSKASILQCSAFFIVNSHIHT